MKNLLLARTLTVFIAVILAASAFFLASLSIFSKLGHFAVVALVIYVSLVIASMLGERILRFFNSRKIERTHEEVARHIEEFLAGKGAAYDWDYFISVPITNPELDQIRLTCGKLPDTHKPAGKVEYCSEEGREVLRKILYRLRKA